MGWQIGFQRSTDRFLTYEKFIDEAKDKVGRGAGINKALEILPGSPFFFREALHVSHPAGDIWVQHTLLFQGNRVSLDLVEDTK